MLLHHRSTPISGSDSVVAGIGDLITSPVKAGSDKYIKVKVDYNPIRLTGNTFECLALSDDVDPLDIAVERGSSRYGSPTILVDSVPSLTGIISPLSRAGTLDSTRPGLPSITEFSDTSPNCEMFKHIKRIDELDYSSLSLSKRKLKKLRKQKHVSKSANASSLGDTNIPYIMEID